MKRSILLFSFLVMMVGALFLTISSVLTGCKAQAPAAPVYANINTFTPTKTPTKTFTPKNTPTCNATLTPGCMNQWTKTPTPIPNTPTATITPAD